jgi:uncharacterized protein YjcR
MNGTAILNDNIVPLAPVRDAHRAARSLYWRGWTIEQIAEELALNFDTVKSWRRRRKWDETSPLERVEDATEARLITLIDKDKKTGGDFKEIDLLARTMAQFARIRRYQEPGGHEGDLNEKVANRNAGPKKKARKNHLPPEVATILIDAAKDDLFGYQENWLCSSSLRTRFILKSRQIGATWYFAREALIRALETGNNQIFISASRAQANIFRQYIVEFVQATVGIKLDGDPIVIDRGEDEDGNKLDPVTFYFLGTNYRTAQGYHGDVYIDEAFWIYGFEQMFKVASAMALQKRYRKTIFSTPSTIAHEAHAMWSGERFNRKRLKSDKAMFDTGHKALRGGKLGADGIWRDIVTIEDAVAGGCDLFDIDELRLEYSIDEFDNLLMCNFIDDSQSMFPMHLLQPCMVDSWEVWRKDFDPYAIRPFGQREVWLGYDPQESATGDNAALVAVAPPSVKGGKFRVLEKLQLRGDFAVQAEAIRQMTLKYNVTHIGIDATGCGSAVWQLVRNFFPTAVRIDYSLPVKAAMVLKLKNVISNRRIEWDSGWIDLAQALMSIRAELTKAQTQITYVASRSEGTGHADLAWALMHAVFNEPLDAGDPDAQRAKVSFG